jgi:acetyl esterase/lipase
MTVNVGYYEMLLDDSVESADRTKKADVDMRLELLEGMFYCPQLLALKLPQGQNAVKNAWHFISQSIHRIK